ncbi:MAG: hypothetical protein J0L96_03000 [Anaerolineae bacterium]|nr:hypothetical protein [Anaerolineae bacterium]
MKTLLRVLIILVVASLISGLMYAAVNASSSSNGSSLDGGRPSGQFRPDGDEEHEERGERGGFGFPGGIIKALALMSIAGGIYSVIVWTRKQAKRAAAR